MTYQEIKEQLTAKLDKTYQKYMSEWTSLTPPELVENAEKIGIIKQIYMQLTAHKADICFIGCHENLLLSEDPLEAIYDYITIYEGHLILDEDDVYNAVDMIKDRFDAGGYCCEDLSDDGQSRDDEMEA